MPSAEHPIRGPSRDVTPTTGPSGRVCYAGAGRCRGGFVMVRRSGPQMAAAVLVVLVVSGGYAAAQEPETPAVRIAGEEAAPAITPPVSAPLGVARAEQHRPGALVPLYASFGALQILDTRSTLQALDRGGVEANPVMKGVVS